MAPSGQPVVAIRIGKDVRDLTCVAFSAPVLFRSCQRAEAGVAMGSDQLRSHRMTHHRPTWFQNVAVLDVGRGYRADEGSDQNDIG